MKSEAKPLPALAGGDEDSGMVKTLRITTIVAIVLAVMFFVLSVVFGGRSDEEFEKFLASAGVVEKFKKNISSQANAVQSQTSPLVLQSEAFAKILNPPPKPRPVITPAPSALPVPIRPTAKFTLAGTCFYEANPEMSLAFIDEPGKGSRWVRQGSQIGHVTIEQIKDGIIVVREGQNITEMAAPQKPQATFLQGSSPVSSATGTLTRQGEGPASPPVTSLAEPAAGVGASPPHQRTEAEEIAIITKSLRDSVDAGEMDSKDAESFLSIFGDSMRITDDEAEKLKELPNGLNNKKEPNQLKSQKVEKPVRPVRAPRPPLPRRQ